MNCDLCKLLTRDGNKAHHIVRINGVEWALCHLHYQLNLRRENRDEKVGTKRRLYDRKD